MKGRKRQIGQVSFLCQRKTSSSWSTENVICLRLCVRVCDCFAHTFYQTHAHSLTHSDSHTLTLTHTHSLTLSHTLSHAHSAPLSFRFLRKNGTYLIRFEQKLYNSFRVCSLTKNSRWLLCSPSSSESLRAVNNEGWVEAQSIRKRETRRRGWKGEVNVSNTFDKS